MKFDLIETCLSTISFYTHWIEKCRLMKQSIIQIRKKSRMRFECNDIYFGHTEHERKMKMQAIKEYQFSANCFQISFASHGRIVHISFFRPIQFCLLFIMSMCRARFSLVLTDFSYDLFAQLGNSFSIILFSFQILLVFSSSSSLSSLLCIE